MATPEIVRVQVFRDPRDNPADELLATEVGKTLNQHYPGWAWYIDIPPRQNVVIIRNLDCNPQGQMGFVIYKDSIDAGMKKVVMAGGEFLERYKKRRGAYETCDAFEQALAKPEQ